VVRGELRKLGAPPLQEPEQRGHGAMYLGHREGSAIEPRAHRAHARQRGQLRGAGRTRRAIRQGELDDVLGTERGDQGARRPSAMTLP